MSKVKKKIIAAIISILVILAIILIILIPYIDRRSLINQHKYFSMQWGLSNKGQIINNVKGKNGVDINILKAWELTQGSPDVLVAVLDSGVDLTNGELKSSIFCNKNEIKDNIDNDNNGLIDDINGWNFYENNNIVFGDYLHDYHGTYISGIIAASNDIIGVAPKIKILPLKFLSGSRGQTKDAIKAIEYAHSLGVRIINCSWDSIDYDQQLKDTMEQYSDILFICSAGKNKSDLNTTPVYPACFDLPNIVSVAAIDNRGELYNLSGYGEKAHVAAPGVDIYSCMPDGDYTFSTGTSAATAFVTGIAGLIKSYNPELNSIEIANILKSSAKEIPQLKGKVQSGGIIDAYLCLKNTAQIG